MKLDVRVLLAGAAAVVVATVAVILVAGSSSDPGGGRAAEVVPSATTPDVQTTRVSLSPPSCSETGRGYDDCPNGKPGWSTGFLSCEPAQQTDDRPPDLAGLSAVLSIPGSAHPGSQVRGTLLLTNGGGSQILFSVSTPVDLALEAVLVGPAGRSARHTTDVVQAIRIALEPGQSRGLAVRVQTTVCGDTQRDVEQPLAAGAYRAQVVIGASDEATPGPAVHRWVIASRITLT